jgi:class 3 adenylate cyclase
MLPPTEATSSKGLGDGVLVAFAGAAEALSAAVAMQQALVAFRSREGVALSMRVGLSAGNVTFENGDCFGTPVIEAARLCAVAASGEILVADLVRLLARAGPLLEQVRARCTHPAVDPLAARIDELSGVAATLTLRVR